MIALLHLWECAPTVHTQRAGVQPCITGCAAPARSWQPPAPSSQKTLFHSKQRQEPPKGPPALTTAPASHRPAPPRPAPPTSVSAVAVRQRGQEVRIGGVLVPHRRNDHQAARLVHLPLCPAVLRAGGGGRARRPGGALAPACGPARGRRGRLCSFRAWPSARAEVEELGDGCWNIAPSNGSFSLRSARPSPFPALPSLPCMPPETNRSLHYTVPPHRGLGFHQVEEVDRVLAHADPAHRGLQVAAAAGRPAILVLMRGEERARGARCFSSRAPPLPPLPKNNPGTASRPAPRCGSWQHPPRRSWA